MKSLKLGLTCALLLSTTAVMAATANEEINQPEGVNRATVVTMSVSLQLPDGSTEVINDINFCTPGGFYNGVEALVFGDEAVKIMQAGMAALYPKTGDNVDQLWTNKSNPDDPRLPTYLMIRAPENTLDKPEEGEEPENLVAFASSAKTFKLDDETPSLIASCGGVLHPSATKEEKKELAS